MTGNLTEERCYRIEVRQDGASGEGKDRSIGCGFRLLSVVDLTNST